jgi:hypothetical protein
MATNINAPNTTQLTPEAVIEQLRALIPAMPGYVQLPKATAQLRRAAANVDAQFVESAMAAIDTSDLVRNGVAATSEDLRTDVDQASRWAAVRDLVREMLKGLDSAVLTRKYRVGFTALQAYGVAKMVARREDQAHLLTHIDSMKRHLGRGRAKKSSTSPAPEPAPQPAPHQQ